MQGFSSFDVCVCVLKGREGCRLPLWITYDHSDIGVIHVSLGIISYCIKPGKWRDRELILKVSIRSSLGF